MTVRTFPGLDGYLAREAEPVEAGLVRAVAAIEAWATDHPDAPGPGELAALRHGVLSGGKRLRPILCVAAWEACAGAADGPLPDAVYDLASALEMIHAYSLMHDDLPCMDDADLRRGRPTTHREHGEAVTIRAGAALIPLAALRAYRSSLACGRDEKAARDIALHLLRAAGAGGMVGGQWLDLKGEGTTLDAASLDELHRRKTGALLSASLVIGATAADAPARVVDAMSSYGRAIGLAFQIADDILDVTATAETLGKNPSDTDLRKSTYVSLHGLDEARRSADELVGIAIDALDRADVESPALVALARYVIDRGR